LTGYLGDSEFRTAVVVVVGIGQDTHSRSDGSIIVRSKDSKSPLIPARKFKLNAVAGDRFLLQQCVDPLPRSSPTRPPTLLWLSCPAANPNGIVHRLISSKEGKMEIRQPFLCGRCGVTVAYQSTPPPAGSAAFLYIPKGAMTEQYVLQHRPHHPTTTHHFLYYPRSTFTSALAKNPAWQPLCRVFARLWCWSGGA
jgi:hypothetical protein